MQPQLHAEKEGLLGVLCPGKKKLLGKTFYLDNVKKRPSALILETISLLGGGVESFLHKDVSFVVTGSQDYLKQQKRTDTKAAENEANEEAQHPTKTRDSVFSKEKQRPATLRPMVCGSRGKALLEKAIRNNELQKSSVLANARSWGVKILYVDDVVLYLKRLTRESYTATHKRPEKTHGKQGSHVVKAALLTSPYLKIEDVSRKYKPLHMQSLTFPSLWYSGRFSPFESLPPQFEKHNKPVETKTRDKKNSKSCTEDKPLTPLGCTPSPLRPRKKDLSYCECCHQHFSNLEEHLQSDQHRAFVLDVSNYTVVDQLMAEMVLGFSTKPPTQSENTRNRPLSPMSLQDVCELEPMDDVEAEHEVQALRRRGSSLCDPIQSSPHRESLVPRPVSPSPELSLTLPRPPTLSPGNQPLTIDSGSQITGPSSPVMPILAVETHPDCDPSGPVCDTKCSPPSSDAPCSSPDPYSQPPVLSPQVPYAMEFHSSYSEPPVLSPKQTLEEHTHEMNTAENPFQCVQSISVSFTAPVVTSVDIIESQGQSQVLAPCDSDCPFSHLRSITPFLRRSRSLPRQSAVQQNPKKRCRSASPGVNRAKRRRIHVKYCSRAFLTEPLELGSEVLVNPEAWLPGKVFPHPKVPSCAAETPGLKQTFATFSVTSAQDLSRKINQTEASVHQHQPDKCPSTGVHTRSQEVQPSAGHSTSVCIEPALIPNLAMLSSSSSDSNWDREVLSGLGRTSAAPLPPADQDLELDKDLLHRPCTWLQDGSYESRLHTALQPSASGKPLCGEDMDSSAFSRTVVKIVEVQH